MTRKPLPKVIRQNTEALRGMATGAAADEEVAIPRSASPHASSGAETAPADFSQPVANDQLPAVPVYPSRLAAKRRALARKIVERHKTYAAVSGLSPLPIVNVAGVTAIIMRMVRQLSNLYGMPFERDRTRAAIIGLMGGAVPTGFGAAAASTLAFLIPGSGFIGLGVCAITAGALTRGIGLVFIEHFETAAS